MANLQTATFGGGCFWCIDAAFRRVSGVEAVTSGYAGGHTDQPTYQMICRGDSGHAEVVQLQFNPDKVSFITLLEMFFTLHDPTQLNRQGNDIGTQYRSVVFYHNEQQQQQTQDYIAQLQPQLPEKIVTEISPAPSFYPAEQYHQDYFTENPNQGYCSVMIAPKVAKFESRFAAKLKN
ncbi:peptide-methionine (S)-S-oxide reductase MsrA [Pseudoalteromonas peptidolytica]|uniref:Peptide methionine sulfoxide reductase MsrA n=1 Tax=Pseudoalteromonas peptidolytica F12-50-A1 TaxID=1315280 RepID=A0A8I0T218_9GAMM|nr:peptide-methionine (S)-S-oxide reductase MsrA [Pseudoalteromonas peptidolytica]MBE0345061.1 peptide-methionine (S)-S-oxide reductase [Pseudoalteromonas peptidolytica F12-50-A1]MDW7550348.1 peptide-methionine (S)-S-oxide reductase MsrA [Pseudoalteromonas peptidolytica]NLR14938.1 peptide-methionine (S)-S-oxide reductase MsrA [Pseudoalteromonas peptidolytica]GEK09403.1 peptide methionine sulfoxide reductase MsrA [Pseudoalteromonas peptidolytica]